MLIILMQSLQWTAWGQATYDYRYWFDQDKTNQHTGTSVSATWQMEVDVSKLSHTYHSIHMQVRDTAGVWSVPVTGYFIKMPVPSESRGYYWLDDDVKTKKEATVENGTLDIDVSALDNKLHYIHYQRNDAYNNTTTPLTGFFLKMPDENSKKTFRYWTDNNTDDVKTVECTGDVMMLDMSGEKDGFHVLYMQGDMDGKQTLVESRVFIKIPQTEGVSELTCLCYVDGTLYKQEKVPSSGGVIDWILDVASLAAGFHRVQVQVVTPTGAATDVHESFFFRTIMDGELDNMKLVYNIDGGEYESQEGSLGTGMFHFDLDVSDLKDGIHRLNYMLMSETGTSTKVNTSFFIKTPVGGPGISCYKYWINDNENEAVKVTLDKRQELFSLISLLPVKTQSIRSSCFHFEIADDRTPMIYAKNDFHIQFVDVKYYYLDAVKQYVDYNVGEAIEEITLLESGKRVYKAKPQDNKIHWFKTEAVAGDSLSIKTDQACTLQIFSPSGKEMYCGSGSETVSFDGCHADEDGTYYIALHDVTGTKGNTIALDFQHIDKYDVLRWDISTVGNGGASTITYEGNGFKDLYAIDYVSTNGDTIKCEYIDHISDATISATMDFNGVTLGAYKAIFHFTEGDRVVDNVVKVEEAKDIVLESKVSYPNQYLRNTSVTYTLNIENRGNMTAYRVPLYIYAASRTENGISKITVDGLDLPKLLDGLNRDSLSAELLAYEEKIGEGHYFQKVRGYSDDLRDSATIRSGYFFVDVAPYCKKTISLTLYANETVYAWFTLPKDIAAMSNPLPETRMIVTRGAIRDHYCCIRERVECVGGLIGDAVGFANTIGSLTGIPHAKALSIADCAIGTLNTVISAAGEVACGENDVEATFYEKLKKIKDGISISGTIVGCFEKFLSGSQLMKIGDLSAFVGMSTHATTWADCVTAFSEKKPGCPPDPPGGGGANPVNSFDPNDIYGYRSESGSKAVKKDWTDVYYTIEFENDTAFATASAQDVYLTDTLDSRYFDLKSFAPTSLKIGDKKVELSGESNFVTTVDMRPKINAIAQVECQYDEQRGIAKWHFTSLDPMTMEHVTVPMDGFLPVNNSEGDGQGEVSFNIRLKTGLADGEQIPNRASIVFDLNEAIMTPTWVNIVDAIAPVSAVVETAMKNDSIMTIFFDGTDNYSGVWKYDLYVQAGVGASWFKLAENLTDSLYDYRVYDGIDYGFCVIATDSAGNVEQKELVREGVVIDYVMGDVNGDDRISIVDITMVTNAILKKEDEGFNAKAADLNADGRVSIVDATMITNLILKK